MKRYDQASSGFWFLISVAVFVESVRLGIGTLHNPGRGFLTFGASGLLGLLALSLFVRASMRKETADRTPLFGGRRWERIFFVLIAAGLYAWSMPMLGYLISTFALMTLLFWVLERKKIGWVFLSSLLSTAATYLFFSKWLNCQFPEGLFGF
ncbi:MAG: tripartite tricarboxylate transporter TctB family protein [Deltaproteobacteria bacterium]|nr:MAG: tripartite tricarboxylate transporter TctB family protein [Deltaproteobacteria bacterium]